METSEKQISASLFGKIGKRKLLLILVAGVVGIILLTLGNSELFKNTTSTVSPTSEISEEEQIEDYRKATEKEIRELCESVKGVGGAQVTVTLSGGFTRRYATEWKDGDERYVTVGSGASASALYLFTEPPQIDGIGVVCRGGGDAVVRQELIGLLSAAYHLPSNRIYITEAQN